MNKETTFFINSAIDTSENATYSLIDQKLDNKATLIIKDKEFTYY